MVHLYNCAELTEPTDWLRRGTRGEGLDSLGYKKQLKETAAATILNLFPLSFY